MLLGPLGEVKTGLHHLAGEVFRYACSRNHFHTYNDYVSESVKLVIWEVLLPSQDNITIKSSEKWEGKCDGPCSCHLFINMSLNKKGVKEKKTTEQQMEGKTFVTNDAPLYGI